VKTVPAVREAIEQKKFGDIDEAISRVASVVNAEAALVERAASALGKAQ
jgi:hypothetical protein